MCNWFLAIRMARLLTAMPKPFSRFWVIEKLRAPWVTGLKSLLGEFCLYPSVLPMPTRDAGAGEEALLDAEIRVLIGRDQEVGAGVKGTGLRRRLVLELRVEEEGGVQVGDGGTGQLDAEAAEHAARAAAAGTAAGGTQRIGARQHAERGRRGSSGNAVVHVAQQGAGAGALEVGLLEFGIEARHLDIEVVLQGQRDGIAQGQVDAAGAYQALDALGILEVDVGHGGGPVVPGEVRRRSPCWNCP